jgi:hypothetical protein
MEQMNRPTAKKTARSRLWTKEDISVLKMLAREKTTTAVTARKLKRTARATYQKAVKLGVKLAGARPKKKALRR